MIDLATHKGRLRRDEIRSAVNDKLETLGFEPHLYRWLHRPSQLEILIGSSLRTIPFKSGMSKRDLRYELARLDAWADFVCRKRGVRQVEKFEPKAGERQVDLVELL